MTKEPEKNRTDVYYHTLYHHLAHWAAYVAMMGILISTGVLLCVTQLPTTGNAHVRVAGIIVGIVLAMIAAIYFNKGMDTYGEILNEMVPKEHLSRTQTTPHKMMIWSGFLCVVISAGWDIFLVLSLYL